MTAKWTATRPVPLDYKGPEDIAFDRMGEEWFERSPIDRFDHVAARHGDRIAVDDGNVQLTYDDVRRAAQALAHSLNESTPAGAPIAAVFRYTALFPVALLASIAAGRPIVPVDAAYPLPRQRMILDNAGAASILRERGVPPEVDLPDLPQVEADLAELLASESDGWPAVAYDPQRMGGVTFTSGSTGTPKGYAWSFGGFVPTVAEMVNTHHLHPGDKIIALGSLASAGLGDALFAMLSGATLRVVEIMAAGIGGLLQIMGEERVTILSFVPAVLRTVLAVEGASEAFRHLRILDLYGDATLPSDIAFFRSKLPPDCHIRLVLGSIECGTIFHWFVPRDFDEDDIVLPCGYVAANKEYAILDPDGEALPPGETGELVVRSRYMALGAWQDGRVTQGPFLPDPDDPETRIYPMGDFVRMRPDGLCEFVGRRDRQVKVRGFRADLGEVEAAMRQHAAIADVAVVTVPIEGDRDIVAYCTLRAGNEAPRAADLRKVVMDATAEHMAPKRIHFIDAIPRLPNYKPDLVTLADMAQAADGRGPEGA